MGINVCLWRIRIGTITQPVKIKSTLNTLKLKNVSLCIRIILFFLLAAQCVETNPGPRGGSKVGAKTKETPGNNPDTPIRDRSRSESLASVESVSTNRRTQQNPQTNLNTWLYVRQSGQDSGYNELKEIMLSVKKTVDNTESRLNSVEASMNEIKESNKLLVESNKRLTEDMTSLNNRVAQLEKDLKTSEDKRESLEAQSRRDNLRFYGIQESRNESWGDTETKVKEYIRDDLQLDSEVKIERAHKIRSSETPRPVIVKFSFYKDKENVISTYRRKRRENAAASDDEEENGVFRRDIQVSEDFPSRVMMHRSKLRRFLRTALEEGKRAFLKYDKLVIGRDTFEYDEEHEDIIRVDDAR